MQGQEDPHIETVSYAAPSSIDWGPFGATLLLCTRRNLLITLLIVSFCAGLAALVTAHIRNRPTHRIKPACGPVSTQLELYRVHMGAYPQSLSELIESPDCVEPPRKRRGRYVTDLDLRDGWGRRLRYQFPGVHHPDRYDLWSVGPDGVDGTDDDIGNWAEE